MINKDLHVYQQHIVTIALLYYLTFYLLTTDLLGSTGLLLGGPSFLKLVEVFTDEITLDSEGYSTIMLIIYLSYYITATLL